MKFRKKKFFLIKHFFLLDLLLCACRFLSVYFRFHMLTLVDYLFFKFSMKQTKKNLKLRWKGRKKKKICKLCVCVCVVFVQ